MTRLGWFAFPVAVAVASCTVPREAEAAGSPELLMRALLEHAKRHDYERVRDLVFPVPAYAPGITVADCVVELMEHSRGPDHTGDFSYSDEALQQIIDRHLHRFVTLTDKSSPWLKPTSRGGLIDDELLSRTGGDPQRFVLFDHRGCHILLVDLGGSFRLVFWEGMNHLLKPG